MDDGFDHEGNPDRRMSREDRIRARARAQPVNKKETFIRELISFHRFILEERCKGRPTEQLKQLLDEDGLHMSEGTLRNYIPQIERSIAALHSLGNKNPSDDEIHRELIEQAKARRAGNRTKAEETLRPLDVTPGEAPASISGQPRNELGGSGALAEKHVPTPDQLPDPEVLWQPFTSDKLDDRSSDGLEDPSEPSKPPLSRRP